MIEKSNWTGIGVVVPKSLLLEAKKRNEFSRTGVYVLVGQDDESELPTIYVGQGDPVRTRVSVASTASRLERVGGRGAPDWADRSMPAVE